MPAPPAIGIRRAAGGLLTLELTGDWLLANRPPPASDAARMIADETKVSTVAFDTRGLGRWDSGLLTFLMKIRESCLARSIGVDAAGLPDGVHRLLDLATAVPEKEGARRSLTSPGLIERVGVRALALGHAAGDSLAFLGEATMSFGRLVSGRARFRRSDLWLVVEDCGVRALPIVSLISILVGLILAFVGAVQLALFGAQIFVANLVGIGMAREMGAMMTAIIMAGRTGAAFAAQLGTMQVNEEIDALKTLGIPPMDFLVLPRMLALILMMPILCLYANLLGIIGGAIVGIGMLDITAAQYLSQTKAALSPTDFAVGVVKAAVFGVLIALSGCLRGMQSGRSASAVGAAATSAVVTAIVLIVVVDGLFAVITNVLGI